MEDHKPPSGDVDVPEADEATEQRKATRKRGPRPRAVPLSREVRYFAPTEVEVRAATADNPEIVITGAAIVYGAAYRVVDMFGEFRETIHAGAVSELITRNVDCRLLLNHEGLPMARTVSGTMDLIDSPDALRFVARLDSRQQLANDFAVAVERGDLSQMSVGMIVGRDDWGHDGETETRDIYALNDLLDISGVTYPCSPTTHIEVAHRMAVAMPLESRARLRAMEVELRAGKVLSADNQSKLVAALTALHDLADAGGVDPANLGPGADEDSTPNPEDGSEGGGNAQDAGIVYPDGSGQRGVPATEAERREQSLSFGDQQSAVYAALCERIESLGGRADIWICDIGSDWVVYESYYGDCGYYQLSYTIDADGAVTFGDDPAEVCRVTSYVPVDERADDTSTGGGDKTDPAPMTTSTFRLLVEAGRARPV